MQMWTALSKDLQKGESILRRDLRYRNQVYVPIFCLAVLHRMVGLVSVLEFIFLFCKSIWN